jgi:hypothetical protein
MIGPCHNNEGRREGLEDNGLLRNAWLPLLTTTGGLIRQPRAMEHI